MDEYLKAMVQGVPLVLVVFLLVELIKRLTRKDGEPAVKGNLLLVSSFVIGTLLGSGYLLSVTRPPVEVDWYSQYVYWFGNIIYGLGLGGAAAVMYEGLKAVAENTLIKLFERGLIKPPDREQTP